jgi:drug/metabolite transporter (DMT)-like permease
LNLKSIPNVNKELFSVAHFPHSHYWPGVPLALGAAAAFGASTPLAKVLLGSINPWMLAGLLYLGSGLGLGVLIAIRKFNGATLNEAKLSLRDLPWLAGTILFGGVFGPVFLLFGLDLTDAAAASLLLNLEAVFTLLLAWIVVREHVDRRLFIGAVAIVAGALLLSWQGDTGKFSWGMILIVFACFSWAIDNNLTRKISATDPYVLAAIKGLCAGSVNTGFALSYGAHWPSLEGFAGAMSLGFVSYGLGLVLFIFALRYLGTARTGAYYGTAPFVGALVATILLGSPLTPTVLFAGLLMAFGAWLHLAERHEHEHLHQELEHDHSHVHDEHHQHEHQGEVVEPHSHLHRHIATRHKHAHYPDLHHRHVHD